jgi:DNA primase
MEFGAEALSSEVSRAKGPVAFLTEAAIKKYGLSIEGKIKILSDLIEPLSSIRDRVIRSLYVRELSEKIGIDETAILEKLRGSWGEKNKAPHRIRPGKFKHAPRNGVDQSESRPSDPLFVKTDRLERQLIAMMIQFPEITPEIKSRRILELFNNEKLKAIGFEILKQNPSETCDVAKLVSFISNDRERQMITSLTLQNEQWEREGCLGLINQYERSRNQLKQRLLEEIKAAEEVNDEDLLARLLIKMQKIAAMGFSYEGPAGGKAT